jgi:hypothetical protein
MVSGQFRINLYAPRVDATRHGPDMFKAVTGEIRGRIQTPDPVMTNKNDLPILWPLGHHLLHQLLREKRGTLYVNGLPFFPAPDIDQWDLVARTKSLGHFFRRNLDLLICVLGGKNGSDDLVYREIVVALANRRQSFTRAEAATRAAADVVGPENGPLSGRVFLEKFRHRGVGVDCSRHGHNSQRCIISPENQRNRLFQGRIGPYL